ncbi:MAG TPA: hypothetical protein VFX35_01330 [Solirubrobacterales bacterium]|nr:hypothetical protein [Solirubrobacterales bacterium]
MAFEKSSGFGHQGFAEEDREDRQRARDEAHDLLTAIHPLLCGELDYAGERDMERADAAEQRAEKAEQELEQEQDLRRRADSLLQVERAKLSEVRAEVEKTDRWRQTLGWRGIDAHRRGSLGVLDRLTAILDSAPSVAGGDEKGSGVGELLDLWEAEHQKVAEGAPGEFDAEERQRARGAVELCQRLRGSLAATQPDNGTGKPSVPDQSAPENSSGVEEGLRERVIDAARHWYSEEHKALPTYSVDDAARQLGEALAALDAASPQPVSPQPDPTTRLSEGTTDG